MRPETGNHIHKRPAFDPWRILGNHELQAAFRKYSTPEKRIYLMAHFDHPNELTEAAEAGIDAAIRSGVICVNQCPIIKGVNDNADVLAMMFRRLSYLGCPQYYLFQGRPTQGNDPYKLPLLHSWEIFNEAMRQGSGLACRARFAMSHETGKIEVLGADERHIYLRYHRAKDAALRGKFMIYQRDDEAYWFDDLKPA